MLSRTPLPPELGVRPFTIVEAHALGLADGRLRQRDLLRAAYGVRRLGPAEDLAQLAQATRLVLPVGIAFSHLTAARTLGLPVPKRWAPIEPLDVMNVTSAPKIRRARLLFLRGGLPEPELNVVINDRASGQWLSDSDFVWREQRVVAEFDGDHHRTDRAQWQNDVAGARTSRTTDGPSSS